MSLADMHNVYAYVACAVYVGTCNCIYVHTYVRTYLCKNMLFAVLHTHTHTHVQM